MDDLATLLLKSVAAVKAMTPEQREEMHRVQRESWARGESGWPAPKFEWVNGVKVYASYADYCND